MEPAGDHGEPGRCQGLHVYLPPRGSSSSVVVYMFTLLLSLFFGMCCACVCVVYVCVCVVYVSVCVHVLVGVVPAGDHEDRGWCQRNRVHLCPINCH